MMHPKDAANYVGWLAEEIVRCTLREAILNPNVRPDVPAVLSSVATIQANARNLQEIKQVENSSERIYWQIRMTDTGDNT